jgi:uncharacterized protein (DUF433 family)
MHAHRARHLRQPRHGFFHVAAFQHHQVRQLVDQDQNVRQGRKSLTTGTRRPARTAPEAMYTEARVPVVTDIGTLIERSPEIRRGRPCIAGTGVSVRRIAGWYNLGLTPEEIAAKIEHLSLAQIHAALTYYHANRDEIDSDIAAEDAAIEEIFPTPAKPQ